MSSSQTREAWHVWSEAMSTDSSKIEIVSKTTAFILYCLSMIAMVWLSAVL